MLTSFYPWKTGRVKPCEHTYTSCPWYLWKSKLEKAPKYGQVFKCLSLKNVLHFVGLISDTVCLTSESHVCCFFFNIWKWKCPFSLLNIWNLNHTNCMFFVVTVILVVNHTKWTCTCSAVTLLQVLKWLSMWNNFNNPFCVSKLRTGIRFVGNRWLHVNNEKVYWNADSLLLQ